MNDRSFGRSPGLPIKIAGAGGELDYLANMVTEGGNPLFFHRLMSKTFNGSGGKIIDVYELVSSDGQFWDILYFDMYHEFNDTQLPEGYKKAPALQPGVGIGCNSRVKNFPVQLLADRYSLLLKAEAIEFKNKFIPPEDHRDKLEKLTRPRYFN